MGALRPAALALTVLLGAVPVRAEGLIYPVDVAVSARGEVCVADPGAHALFKLAGGTLQVVARGSGRPRTPLYGIRQIAPEPDGSWVASDPASMSLLRIEANGDLEALPDGRFVSPWAVAVEPSGDVLVADRTTEKLRRVARDGAVMDLATVRAARALLFDDHGGVLVLTDRTLVRVTGGKVEPVLDGQPFSLALDAVRLPDGGYAVTDGYARTIWRVTPEGRVSPLTAKGALQSPQGIALSPEGDLLVADPRARAVFRVSLTGKVQLLAR